jgi:hypothetical protein
MLSLSLNVDGEFLSGKAAKRVITSGGTNSDTMGNVAAGKVAFYLLLGGFYGSRGMVI